MTRVLEAPWEYDIAPFAVTDNVWYVGNAQVASHLIDTGAGLLLLDTGWPSTLYLLLESIRMLGFDPRDLRWILHSHAHVDHFGGTRRLVEKYGCETYLGRNDLPLLRERSDLTYADENAYLLYADFPIDYTLSDGETIQFGNVNVTVREAPGHTPGTLGIFFDSFCDGKPVRVGMHGGVGINTLESGYMRAHGVNWRAAYLDSMESMMRERVDVVLGNHPYQAHVLERLAAAKPGENPFFDPSWWGAFLSDRLQQYRALLKKDPAEDCTSYQEA